MATRDPNPKQGADPDPTPPKTLANPVVFNGDDRGPLPVTLTRAAAVPTADQALWTAIRNRCDAIGFGRYTAFINRVLCTGKEAGMASCGSGSDSGGDVGGYGSPSLQARMLDLAQRPGLYGSDAFQLLKLATQAFLLYEGGVVIQPPRDPATGQITQSLDDEIPGEEARRGEPITYAQAQADLTAYLEPQIGGFSVAALPYLKRVVEALLGSNPDPRRSPFCDRVLTSRLSCPSMTELIWSYWMEQSHLVQGMNAIVLRFQNRRRGSRDPLANLALDPLRPLSGLLWGHVQDAPNQLSVTRRAHEYLYAYGLDLQGQAVAGLAPVENRSSFIEAFHNLLHRAAEFHEADAITTVRADGFRLLQALKEVHQVLAEGANNQFDDLKRQARAEMLQMQWLISRPEMREFLRGRAMVPYPEAWMSEVDTMNRLQGWAVGSVNHYYYLATTGEQLLLSIRWGDWSNLIEQEAAI
ncbi:MAG: hypothetical protein OEW22_09390, partial [Rubrivivax sp.]|nr:hypothetical protein [Rubrivivax sp.]